MNMDYKLLAVIVVTITFLFKAWMLMLEIKSEKRPIPQNVSDVYEKDSYMKWAAYHGEKTRLSFISHIISFVVTLAILIPNTYAHVVSLFPNAGDYISALVVLVTDIVITLVFSIPIDYIDTMKIEQKYGFNKSTVKTFIIDQIKSTVIELMLTFGLCAAFIAFHKNLGSTSFVIAMGILIFCLVLIIAFLYPVFSKIFNKFTPLADGELRDKLCRLLEENGCTVKEIKVMDASRRSTKADAYFSGFGKTKTIVLFDTLLEQMTPDEIVAVFAHEVGHNKFKHTTKMQCMSIINIVIIMAFICGLVSFPKIYGDFGFENMNYGFAFYLLATVCLAFISPFFGLLNNALSRKFEYAADNFAAKNGYAESLISALKKLAKNSYVSLSPDPILVKLTYSHPTISERITALRNAAKEEKQ